MRGGFFFWGWAFLWTESQTDLGWRPLAIISPAIEADPFDGDACMLASWLSLSLGDVQKAEMYASMARRACPSRGGPDKP